MQRPGRRITTVLGLILLLFLAIFLGACGDSSGGSTSANDSTPATLKAKAQPSTVTLTWGDVGADSYNLYYSTAPDCDIDNYASCDGGTMLASVTSPYTVSSLTNGQNYWFHLESVATGDNAISNEAGARPAGLVPNRSVHAIVHDATSGVTYLGGQFTGVGMSSGNGVPLSMTTGYAGAFPPVSRSGGSGMVNTVVSDGAGGYYIGGYFDTVDGQPRNNLAHILADGTLGPWSPSVNLIVNALAFSDNTVYVGGIFTSITDSYGTYTRRNLAAIDTSGNVTSWDPGPNSSGYVYALAVSGSMVYVGGSFTDFGGGTYTRNHLAAFDTGSLTPSIPTDWDPNASGTVYALALSGSTVYVGGIFTDFGSGTYARNNLAAFDTGSLTPSIPTDWDPNAGGTVYALAVSGSMVYVGGNFSDFGSGTYLRNNLAAFDTASLTPSVPTDWNPDADDIVKALAVSGSTVYAGGQFTTIDDGSGALERNSLAAIGTDGTLSTWNPAPDSTVLALAVSGSTVYAGGSFISTGSEPRNLLAAINADGTLNTSWHPNASGSGAAVYALAVYSGTVFVGGDFTTVDDGHGSGTQTRNELAAIGTDGTLSTTWKPSANNKVRALAVYSGIVYVGGQFTTMDDGSGVSTRIGLAAIDASTGLLTAWEPRAAGGFVVVYALAVSGSTVYAGGDFDGMAIGSATPLTRSNLAAIDTSGAGTVLDWDPDSDNWVRTLAISGSTVYAGGDFTSFGGGAYTRNRLAAFDTGSLTPSVPTDWSPGANNNVYALAVSGSTVYVGGYFTTIDDGSTAPTRNRLAAIDTTTGLLSDWNPDASGPVIALAVSDSSVYAGGGFLNMEGEYRPNFATLAP